MAQQPVTTPVRAAHQIDLAREFADRIVALAGGRIAFDGPPARLDDDVLRTIYGTSETGETGETQELHS